MRKKLAFISTTLLVLSILAVPASAANTPALSEPDAMLPVDIVVDTQANEIRKVYDLPPNTDPSTLPMEAFERDEMLYECTDILREVIIGNETQVITQSETVESEKKDLETLLELLPQEKEVTTEDGYTGTLMLDLDSIKSEVSGYGTSSKAVTATRSYPNLSDADTNHIPKTVEDGGRTLTLQDVQWQTDNTYNADDYEIGDRYTAICTYGGTKSTSYVKGYTTTADYTGEVFRTGVSVIRYTVIFSGTPVEPVEPEQTSDAGAVPVWLFTVFPALAALGAGVGGTYYLMRRKERKGYEEMENHGGCYTDNAHGDDDTGSGGGVSN
ncbi:MAG: cell wall protein [Eubacteriales bacterium]|nr:cell wall protein [Eubacteriales bacterium]